MNRSISTRNFQQERTVSPSCSRRGIYINEQTNKREVGTHFHSPFKDGRPNKQYINPSFISNHLFYPHTALENQEEFVIKKNLVPNPNDVKKQILYQQRIKRENSMKSAIKSKQKQIALQRQQKTKINRTPFRLKDPEDRLKIQLNNLKNYRQHLEESDKKQIEVSRKYSQKAEVPVYLQHHRRDYEREFLEEERKRGELSKHVALNNQLRLIKEDMKRSSWEEENRAMERTISANKNLKSQEDYQNRRTGLLLGNILKEQIRTNAYKRERKWNL